MELLFTRRGREHSIQLRGPVARAAAQLVQAAWLVAEFLACATRCALVPSAVPPLPCAEKSKAVLDQASRRVQELEGQASSLQAQLGEAQKQLAAWQGKVGRTAAHLRCGSPTVACTQRLVRPPLCMLVRLSPFAAAPALMGPPACCRRTGL